MKQRLRPVAVFRAGARHPVTEPAAWPNPEAQALCRPSWDSQSGLKDKTAPPPVNALFAAAVAGRAAGLEFLAGRLPNGDCNPNVPLTLTLGTFAARPQWLSLPYCEELGACPPPLPLLLADKPAEGLTNLEEEEEEEEDQKQEDLRVMVAGRQLIGGFELSEEEQGQLRRALLCGCC